MRFTVPLKPNRPPALSPDMELSYEALEKLTIGRPVDRVTYIAECCRGRVVLDIGCLDETALAKRDTQHWLHGRLAETARQVVGVDSSDLIPNDGIITGQNSIIHRGNGIAIDKQILDSAQFDVIVAGEFIEHIDNQLGFLESLKRKLPGRELIFSTPNAVSFANTMLGIIGRESQHRDHLANFSFKILNTLCRRAEFERWDILPYRFYATEMILRSRGAKRSAAVVAERGIRIVEWAFPLLSFGYIVRAIL